MRADRISVSSVYVYSEMTFSRRSASRENARYPEVASLIGIFTTRLKTHEPTWFPWRRTDEISVASASGRTPTTTSASPRMIGRDDSRDVRRVVLAVAVEVDDDVGARRERRIHAGAESADEAAVAAVSHDRSAPAAWATTAVPSRRAVVDDDHLAPRATCGTRRGTAATTAPTLAASSSAGMTTASLEDPVPRTSLRGAARSDDVRPRYRAMDALNVPHHVEAIDPRLVEAGTAVHRVLSTVPGIEAIVADARRR